MEKYWKLGKYVTCTTDDLVSRDLKEDGDKSLIRQMRKPLGDGIDEHRSLASGILFHYLRKKNGKVVPALPKETPAPESEPKYFFLPGESEGSRSGYPIYELNS